MSVHKKARVVSFRTLIYFFVALGIFTEGYGFPTPDEDRFGDRELGGLGSHQFAVWLRSQLRKGEFAASPESSEMHYRLPVLNPKRNSELTSSIMGLPRNMIDNGRNK